MCRCAGIISCGSECMILANDKVGALEVPTSDIADAGERKR